MNLPLRPAEGRQQTRRRRREPSRKAEKSFVCHFIVMESAFVWPVSGPFGLSGPRVCCNNETLVVVVVVVALLLVVATAMIEPQTRLN
jgi:hypothetical protein